MVGLVVIRLVVIVAEVVVKIESFVVVVVAVDKYSFVVWNAVEAKLILGLLRYKIKKIIEKNILNNLKN